MAKRLNILFKNQKGYVIVLTALMLPVFLVITAIVIDGSYLYLQKTKLKKAVDAAALAGIQELPERPDKAQNSALYAVEQNGILPSHVSVNFNSEYSLITVNANEEVQLFFGNSLGFPDPLIHAKASAQLLPLVSRKNAIPLGVIADWSLSFGDLVKLKVGPADASGSFGSLVLSGTGAKDYENDLAYGFSTEIKVGDELQIQTGNMAGPTQKAMEYRFSTCPYHGTATYLDYPENCPLVVPVIMYELIPTDPDRVRVVGFASFFIEEVGPINEGSPITGRFLKSTFSGQSQSTNRDFGASSYKLVE